MLRCLQFGFCSFLLLISTALTSHVQAIPHPSSPPVQTIASGHSGGVYSVSFSPDGKTLATGSFDGTTRLWDVSSGLPHQVFDSNQGYVSGTKWLSNGQTLFDGHWNGALTWRNVANGHQVKSLKVADLLPLRLGAGRPRLAQLAVTPDGSHLYFVCRVEKLGGQLHLFCINLEKVTLEHAWPMESVLRAHIVSQLRAQHKTVPQELSLYQLDPVPQLSSDGQQLAYPIDLQSGGLYLGTYLSLWNAQNGAFQRAFRVDNAVAGTHFNSYCTVWAPDKKHFALGGYSTDLNGRANTQIPEVRVWDTTTGTLARCYKGAKSDARSLAFSPDGQFIVGGGMKGDVTVWNFNTGDIVSRFNSQADWISSLAFSLQGNLLASASNDGSVELRHFPDGSLVHVLPKSDGVDTPLGFSADSHTLISTRDSKRLYFWNVEDGSFQKSVLLPPKANSPDAYSNLVLSPDASKIALLRTYSNTVDNKRVTLYEVAVCDVKTGATNLFTVPCDNPISSVAFSPDSTRLAIASPTVLPLSTLRGFSSPGLLSDLFPSRDKLLPVKPTRIEVWDIASASRIWSKEEPEFQISSVAFSPDGKQLAVGLYKGRLEVSRTSMSMNLESLRDIQRYNGEVRLWDAQSGETSRALARQSAVPGTLSFLPNGQSLVCMGDGQARIWNIQTGELEQCIPDAGSVVRASPLHERLIATVEPYYSSTGEGERTYVRRGTVKVIPLSNYWPSKEVQIATDVTSAVFSPNEKWLAVATPRGIEIRDGITPGTPALFTMATVSPALASLVPTSRDKVQWITWKKDGSTSGSADAKRFLWPIPIQSSKISDLRVSSKQVKPSANFRRALPQSAE